MKWTSSLTIGSREVGLDQPTYFIADIASSHDGDIERAKALIWLSKEAGADCAKFQHFLAKDIVSDAGFKALGGQMAHQSGWKQSVYEVFEQYQTPRDWTETLVAECAKAGVDYMTTPYDLAAVKLMDPHLKAFKIGSGDIAWLELIKAAADRGKPVFISTGAADMDDAIRAVEAALEVNPAVCVMQCNTNYTGSLENFGFVNLNVLRAYALKWPGMVLGFSDHTPGHSAVLGAVTLGARAVEKHFTDDNSRDGPDHPFSMNPKTWREMVDSTRELELALGDGVKRVEMNEVDSAIVQRRALRLTSDLPFGHFLNASDVEVLRPKPDGALEPCDIDLALGKVLTRAKKRGEALFWNDLGAPSDAKRAAE